MKLHWRYSELNRRRLFLWYEHLKPLKKCLANNIKLDIIIPVIERDCDVLPYVIDGARENIQHPIGKIFLVAPLSDKIKKISIEKNCQFIDETSASPISKDVIDKHPILGNRTGWLIQQLIKLNGDILTKEDYFLVMDADTVLIRPQTFIIDDKQLLHCSDEFHKPYFETYQKLLNSNTHFPLSFISHYMLFNKEKLLQLKETIEKNIGLKWYDAIISCSKTNDSFSEYETYGNFITSKFPKTFFAEYWFNLSLKRKDINNIKDLANKYKKKYKSISFHHWIK